MEGEIEFCNTIVRTRRFIELSPNFGDGRLGQAAALA
jgi:hypothetical protein